MQITTRDKLARSAQRELVARAARLERVIEAHVMREEPVEIEEALEDALDKIAQNPAHVLRWLSTEEVVLMSLLEED